MISFYLQFYICICMCVCMYICMYICTYIYIHVYICVCVYGCMCVYHGMYVFMHSLQISAKTFTTTLTRIVSFISPRAITDDFPDTTATGSVFSSAVEQDTELQSLPKDTPTSNLFGVILSDARRNCKYSCEDPKILVECLY
jgi:hypothetical protein